MKIALAQLDLPMGDPEENLDRAEVAVKQAADQGADLVLLPELWASGYDLEKRDAYASGLTDGWFAKMSELARTFQVALGGSLVEKDAGKFFNTFLLLDQDGNRLGAYRKIHLFQFLQEDKYLTAGQQLAPVDAAWGKLGLAVCYDLRFPEMFRSYALKGVELILLVAEWPRKRIPHWDILLQARAVENQCFMAAVNKVGTSQGAPLGGNSAVIDPMGRVLVQGDDQPAVLVAEVDLGESQRTRSWMPVLQDRDPSAYD